MTPRPQGNNEGAGDVVEVPQQQQQQQQQDQQLVRANIQRERRIDIRDMENAAHGEREAEPAREVIYISDDDDDDQERQRQRQQQQQQRQYLAIEDESEWLRRYGLRGEPHYGAESYSNQKEAKQRIQDHVDYQAQIHARLFEGATESEHRRQAQLDKWSNQVVKIEASTGTPIECNLGHLASHCDTVFTMAESRHHYESSLLASEETPSSTPLLLSLRDYSHEAVQQFLELLKSSGKSKNNAQQTKEDMTGVLPNEQYVVECCQIANYLQCNALLDDVLVPLLIQSVDSANCLSLCQLADQLSLSALLEASVNHMMRSLGSVEEHDIWGDLTPELQSRIQMIQQILQSSNRRQLFFSSFEEYLALFAEQVDYYRERLDDAIHQQSSHPEQSGGWKYTQSKIDQQKERVRILKLVLQEQKKLFRSPRAQPSL
mmetsp:Transcript_4896/g.13895  ORF Transcript_4896/g.13895 Transcript_4896/m.13895 type:complete len:432 (+) Transcript_4896:142-1437(+)